MKKNTIVLLLGIIGLMSCSTKESNIEMGEIAILPKPQTLVAGDDFFEINSKTSIGVENEDQAKIAKTFFNQFTEVSGWHPSVEIGESGNVKFTTDASLKNEGYALEVTSKSINIKASSNAGFFYALQSLKQLFPPSFYKKEKIPNSSWGIPAVKIEDSPAFGWRGYMLDVSRHFFDKEDVKKTLDFMAELKLNRFHWHLTDDQGWRLEIKSYPKLTEVGAWRVDHNVSDENISNWWGRPVQKPNEKATYGGFYTQEDVKEIIAYAKERHIEVIPEIDIPGHSQAAVAAYPEIGCVNASPYVATGGVAKNNTYNPGKEETYEFVETMLNEVMELFPFKYVHIGGDECNKSQWKVDPFAKKKMKEEGLKNEHELQSYFIKRVENIINAKGKTMIGWDEILEGGLAPNATVMSWRGESGGITSAKAGHEVIMTPSNYCYIDLKQGQDDLEPNLGYSRLLLSTAYSYKVIPDALTAEEGKLIKGIQANMWTESISDWSKLSYMTFPRIYAIAENGWTHQKNKDWNDFTDRLLVQFKKLEAQNIRFAKSAFSPSIEHKGKGKQIAVSMKTEVNGLNIRYTLDGSEPTLESKIYKDTIQLEKSSQLKARAFLNSIALGKTSAWEFPFHSGINAKVIDVATNKELSKLTDLSYAKFDRGDKAWQSFSENSEFNIFLDNTVSVKQIKLNALRFTNSAIYPPEAIEVLGSSDGKTFSKLGTFDDSKLVNTQGRNKLELTIPLKETKVKVLKFKLKTINPIPNGHRAAGRKSFIYIDEIRVE